MSIQPQDPMVPPRKRPLADYVLLASLVVAGVGAAAGIAAAIVLLSTHGSAWWAWIVLPLAALLVAGAVCCSLLLLGLRVSRSLELLGERVTTLDQRTAIIAEQSVARGQAILDVATRGMDPAELRALLLELRETLLLPDDYRTFRFQKLVEREFDRRLGLADQYISSKDFHRARAELSSLVERFGRDERVGNAEDRLEAAAEAARASDLAQVLQRVQDLMGLARWDEAEHSARELADKYPAAQEPVALVMRVQRERKLFEQRHRQRLHEEIQQSVNQRRWREAAEAAKRFIENFPTGPDTDVLRGQLETLGANADIEVRQELERELKDLVRQHRYWDAVALARRIITEHPLSPQANVLRNQLARLEELARSQEPQK